MSDFNDFMDASFPARDPPGCARMGSRRGLTGVLPIAREPRLFAGYAFGSGDSEPEAGTDRSFRQTGMHANEAGVGGVERYAHYGVLLDPELSNLGVPDHRTRALVPRIVLTAAYYNAAILALYKAVHEHTIND